MAYYPNLRVGNFSYNLLNLTIPEILSFNAGESEQDFSISPPLFCDWTTLTRPERTFLLPALLLVRRRDPYRQGVQGHVLPR